MSANFRLFYVQPPPDWRPTAPSDTPPMFVTVSAEENRCAMNVGIVQAERFNIQAIKLGSLERWAILVRDKSPNGKAGLE